MKDTLEILNQMQSDGIIGRYAIGGAVGATFYLEPAATLDIDVFVSLSNTPGGILSLAPIYDYLTARGCRMDREYIVVGNWPVQFLPPSDALDEEALAEAIETDVDGIRVRVMTAEHLAAIALRTGRAKDKIRVEQPAVTEYPVPSRTVDEMRKLHAAIPPGEPMTPWMQKILVQQKILESKRAARKENAALPFARKLELLEKLRQRSLLIASSSLRRRVEKNRSRD